MTPRASRPAVEHRQSFGCFGSDCTVIVADQARVADAAAAVADCKRRLLGWHGQFSRFEPGSELSRLNSDQRQTVAVSPLMRRVLEAALRAAHETGGLVDATLGAEIAKAGYDSHFEGTGLPLEAALGLAPPRRPAGPDAAACWRSIELCRSAGTISRPPGVKLDAGGIAKGVLADELASLLVAYDAFVIDCAGDIRLGGRAEISRAVHVASPFDESLLHSFELASAAIATSGIGRRSWIGRDGRPAHHLLDPRTGRPAFTGVVQATALAPTAAEAEVLSKAAILSGPDGADRQLRHGGVVVLDDRSYRVIEPSGAGADTCNASHEQISAST